MINNKFKYSQEIEWSFNKKKNSTDFYFNKESHLKTDSPFLKSFNKDLIIRNNDIKYKKETKKNSKVYYGFLFCFFFCFLFFATISISSAKSINNNDLNTIIYLDNNSSYKLLEKYLLEEKEENNNETIITENNIFKKIEFSKYRVLKNDTIKKIANKFGLTVDTIILCNNLKKVNNLKSGILLSIPNQNGRLITVKANDSILKIADRFGVSWEKLSDANNLSSEVIHPGMKLFIPNSQLTSYEKSQLFAQNFIWPIKGAISSKYGSRIDPISKLYSFHMGLDIRNHEGTSVKAAADGKVVFVGWDNVYGNFIMIKHENKVITMYAHLKSYIVSKGLEIKQGDKIGYVGSTGRSTGPHLHFQVTENGNTKDPLNFLPK